MTKRIRIGSNRRRASKTLEISWSSKSTIYLRDGHLARNDANTVDLDVETTEMSKNTVMITALDGVLRRQSNIFSSILDASSKLS